MWDLQRNGGSVAATTERVLSGRGLDVVGLYFIQVVGCMSTIDGNLDDYMMLIDFIV